MQNTKTRLIKGTKFFREIVVKGNNYDSKLAAKYLATYLDLVESYLNETTIPATPEFAEEIFKK